MALKRARTTVARTLVFGGAIFLAWPSNAIASERTNGIAYDTVWKIVSDDHPPMRPGDFQADFHATPEPGACTVPTYRRYMTAERERIDDVCRREATIVDCIARTATEIAFDTKTYVVASLDAAYDDGIAGIAADARRSGLRSTLSIRHTALGRRRIGRLVTDAYETERRQLIVASSLSTDETWTWTDYFLPTPLPRLTCATVAAPWLSRYSNRTYDPELGDYFEARSAKLAEAEHSRRTESGPAPPPWHIALFSLVRRYQRQSGVADITYFFEVESGNVRPVRDDDSTFTTPAGFTELPATR